MKPKSDRLLALETQAANNLRIELQQITDDPDAIRDTIEGETDLRGLIALVMSDIGEDEIIVNGITAMLDTLAQRRNRVELRIERRRAAVQRAMEAGELSKLELPSATLSLRKVPPKLEVTDETLIPEQFWKPQAPKLDRTAIKDALLSGTEVPGAMMGNGGQTLAIRKS